MKILVCTVFPIPHTGGASTHIELLINALRGKNIYAGLICGNDLNGNWIEKTQYVLHRITSKDSARAGSLTTATRRLRKAIEEVIKASPEKIVLHCHDPLATTAAIQAVKGKVPIIQTVHGPWARENVADGNLAASKYNVEIRNLEKQAYRFADMLVPVDNGQADILMTDFSVPSERIKVIENAVDIGAITREESIANLITQPSTQYFVVPRRLVPKNGVEYAIRAISQLDNKSVELVIAGDGPLRKSLQELAQTLGITHQIKFLGDTDRKNVLSLMKGSIGVIVPSVPYNGVVEATSLAVLESMACGAPVIGSSIGGIKDIIVDQRYGILVEPGNAGAICSAMRNLLNMTTRDRKILVTNARDRLSLNYSATKWADSIVSVYHQLLTERSV